MSHPKFLEQIASYYLEKYDESNLSDFIFIFPNKRSALFLKHYFQQQIHSDVALLPHFTTFSRFLKHTADATDVTYYEALFILYESYCEVLKEKNPGSETITEFDKFIFWGDMILSDFNTIDSSLADAEKLYANLKGYKELTSDYLTDEQKEIINRLWGETRLTQHVEGFWLHTGPGVAPNEGGESSMYRKFISLWEILSPIYQKFQKKLKEKGLSTPGMQARTALEKIKDTNLSKLRRKHYVFVGQADLSNAELAIMNRLKDSGAADFFWDIASPIFQEHSLPEDTVSWVRFIHNLAKSYPMPDDFELDKITGQPEINIYGIPSAIGQTKIIGDIVSKLNLDEEKAFDTAIVLPEPSLLTSLMVSLPDDVPGINITMGLPYSATKFATLFSALIAMQRMRRRDRNGGIRYFYQNVLEILLHPHIQLIAGVKANLMRQVILDKRLFNVEASMLMKNFEELGFLFRPINDIKDNDDSHDYILNVIKGLRELISAKPERGDAEFEISFLNYFEEQVNQLNVLISDYSIRMEESTFLSIFERILMSKNINMEGTPLKGLQIMGVLETRVLDFDYIIMPSLNERIFPRHEYVKTMIPNSLRRGYGLPSIEHVESFYSYYFYRMISRARNVNLLYDTRMPGKGRGEISRFLQQLLYIHNEGNVKHILTDMKGSASDERQIIVAKTPAVMQQLEKFKQSGGPRLSASSLKKYLSCPLRFYLEIVNNLKVEDEPSDYINAAEMGNIFHHAAQKIYQPFKGKPVTAEDIENILSGDTIEKAVIYEIAKLQGINPEDATKDHLNTEGRLLLSLINYQIRTMLEAEKATYCPEGKSFIFVDAEKDVFEQWKVGNHTFNFRMQIDRIDRTGDNVLRFIDYKTGTDSLELKQELSHIFSNDHKTSAIFQLLTYAAAFTDLIDNKDDIEFKLHITRSIVKEKEIKPITYKRRPIGKYSELKEEFYPLLENLINSIFDDTTPFTQCEDAHMCKNCPFLSVCGRTLPKEF